MSIKLFTILLFLIAIAITAVAHYMEQEHAIQQKQFQLDVERYQREETPISASGLHRSMK
jgi:hypothetical protein